MSRKAYFKEYRARKRSRIRAMAKNWRERNHSSVRSKANAWAAAHPEVEKARYARWTVAHKLDRSLYIQEWRRVNGRSGVDLVSFDARGDHQDMCEQKTPLDYLLEKEDNGLL